MVLRFNFCSAINRQISCYGHWIGNVTYFWWKTVLFQIKCLSIWVIRFITQLGGQIRVYLDNKSWLQCHETGDVQNTGKYSEF